MYSLFLKYCEKAFRRIIYLADIVFTPKYNPFYCLGAIAITFLALIFISGIYLFIFYKIDSPYESVKYITEGQWHIGRVMRSVHRYSSAGLVITAILHMLHVFFTDRYRHWRTIAWISGIAILIAIWFTGVIGYWLVWDERSQMIAQLTSAFLDYLPVFKGMLSLSFSSGHLVTGMFFFITLLVHLFVPVLLFFLLWVHVMRLSKPVLTPPRNMAYAIGGFILLMAVLKPVVNLMPANSRKIIAITGIDWFYLFIFPVINIIPLWAAWAGIVILFALLAALPWFISTRRASAAVIAQDKCTGCSLCFNDCPYDAIHMRPRTDGKSFELEALVMPERCAGCGICAGSCSYDAVILPDRTVVSVLEEIKRVTGEIRNGRKPAILGLGCSYSVPVNGKDWGKDCENVRYIKLPCAGMIHRSWIEYAFDSGADGVFVLGCQMNDCQYRFGNKWIEERFSYERPPRLNRSVDRSRLRVFWLAQAQKSHLLKELKRFEEELGGSGIRHPRIFPAISPNKLRFAFSAASLLIPALIIVYLSEAAYTFSSFNESRLVLSIKHTSKKVRDCDEMAMLEKEADKYRKSLKTTGVRMQLEKLGGCARERNPVYLELYIDNKKVLGKDYAAAGVSHDGTSFVFEKYYLKPGVHNVLVKMRDSGAKDRFDYTVQEQIEFKAGYIRVVDFDEAKKQLRIS